MHVCCVCKIHKAHNGVWGLLWNKLAELSLTIKYLPFVQKAPHGGLTCISKKRFSSGNIGGGQY